MLPGKALAGSHAAALIALSPIGRVELGAEHDGGPAVLLKVASTLPSASVMKKLVVQDMGGTVSDYQDEVVHTIP